MRIVSWFAWHAFKLAVQLVIGVVILGALLTSVLCR